jgi:hypothetical protein
MCSCLYDISSFGFIFMFSKVMVSLIGPYSCLFFRMCNAYAE